MDVWTKEMKLEKKSCQIMLSECIQGRYKVSRLVTIENGEIIEKPDDIELLGMSTPEGFSVRGLRIIKDDESKANCIICGKEYRISEFWISEIHSWMKLCDTCWHLPYEEKEKAIEEYRKKIFKDNVK